MYNQFRTLLLNLPYAADSSEHIPATFNGLILPSVLNNVYNILFPADTSRYYKQFLAQNYLRIITSAGLESVFYALDPRVTYSLDTTNYFGINQTSNPILSDSRFPIFTYGSYSSSSTNNYYYDDIIISQIENTSYVTVYSKTNNWYFSTTGTTVIPTQIELTAGDGGVSLPVLIGATGLSFTLAGDITSTSGKTWEIITQGPYYFNFNTFYNSIKSNPIASAIFDYRPDVNVLKYQNLFNQHFNSVYQMAGFLVAYVIKCNSL